ncbi:MAG: SH3 domain-containing protein [Chloroflexota bacterium]
MRRFYGLITLAVVAFLLVGATAKSFMQATQPPTPTAICSPAPSSRLILRERARVSLADPRPLNMRDGPGTSHPVIAQIPASGILYVVEGPSCGQNYAWYKVEFEGLAGWIAEGDDRAYFVDVYPPG